MCRPRIAPAEARVTRLEDGYNVALALKLAESGGRVITNRIVFGRPGGEASGDPGGDGGSDAGDSGGAVFAKYNGSWVLVGIMGAIGTYNNQPGSHAIYGNVTYYASVPAYYSFITTAIPEPADVASWIALAAVGVAGWRRRRARALAQCPPAHQWA